MLSNGEDTDFWQRTLALPIWLVAALLFFAAIGLAAMAPWIARQVAAAITKKK